VNVSEVKTLYRSYVQENDERWHDSWVATAMKNAYNQFRGVVMETSPFYYVTRATLTVTGNTYDLSSGAVSVLGSSPTNTKMSRLVSLWKSSAGKLQNRLKQGTTPDDSLSGNHSDFWLEGDTIRFAYDPPTGEYTLVYVPQSTVDWDVGTYIDDLDEYHELIALYAAERYMIRDGMLRNIQRVRADMEDRLADHLVTMMGDAGRTITNVP